MTSYLMNMKEKKINKNNKEERIEWNCNGNWNCNIKNAYVIEIENQLKIRAFDMHIWIWKKDWKLRNLRHK